MKTKRVVTAAAGAAASGDSVRVGLSQITARTAAAASAPARGLNRGAIAQLQARHQGDSAAARTRAMTAARTVGGSVTRSRPRAAMIRSKAAASCRSASGRPSRSSSPLR